MEQCLFRGGRAVRALPSPACCEAPPMRKLPTGDIRVRENRPHGSEGGEARAFPTPIGLFINILAHNENCCFPAKPLDLLHLPQTLLSLNLQGTLLTQIVLPRLVGVAVAFFLGKQFQGVHGLPHFNRVHPVWQRGFVQLFNLFEKILAIISLHRAERGVKKLV